ncbi:MAG: secondary thiamine-phosphate synthase enzyme YjbQ [Opitutae bacterium]
MAVFQKTLTFRTVGKGTVEITGEVQEVLRSSGLQFGTATVFVQHTSCSLVIMENADPSARRDLEVFMDDLVPDNYPKFIHTHEGPDDMPSHIKMALTRTTEVIPFSNGKLTLGTWQGIFLWEHRVQPHNRRIVLSMQGD